MNEEQKKHNAFSYRIITANKLSGNKNRCCNLLIDF